MLWAASWARSAGVKSDNSTSILQKYAQSFRDNRVMLRQSETCGKGFLPGARDYPSGQLHAGEGRRLPYRRLLM